MRSVDVAGAERSDQQHNRKKARLEAGMPLADALVAGSSGGCGGGEEAGGCLSMRVEEIVQHPLPGYGAPVALSFSPDDRRVAFLYSPDGTLHREVFTFDPAQRRQELLFWPPDGGGLEEGNLSAEERLRRERTRERGLGVTRYEWRAHHSGAPSSRAGIVVPLPSGECLLGILASKTVVYVTHHVEFLPSADVILVLKDGKITQAGDYTEILNSGEEFTELIVSHKDALSTLDMLEHPSGNFESSRHPGGNGRVLFITEEQKDDNNGGEGIVQNGQLVQEEEREKGRVGFIVYWKYITTAYNGALVPLILLAQIIFQVQIGSNLWMAWAAPISKDVNPPVSSLMTVNVYVALALVSSLCIFI